MGNRGRKWSNPHVILFGWMLIVANASGLYSALLALLIFVGIGVLSGDLGAVIILGPLGLLLGLIVALVAAPGLLAGIGLLWGQKWGRILGVIVATFSLLNFPLGTILGAYGLWALLQNGREAKPDTAVANQARRLGFVGPVSDRARREPK